MMACYPDYGKAPPEYLVTLVEVIASFEDNDTVRMICDPTTGVASRQNFLPSVATVVAFVDELELKRLQFRPAHTAYPRLFPPSERPKPMERVEVYDPFPKLTDAIQAAGRGDLLKLRTWDMLCAASKLLATESVDKAITYLERTPQSHLYRDTPKTPDAVAPLAFDADELKESMDRCWAAAISEMHK